MTIHAHTATAVVSGRHHRRLESHLCVRVSWRQPSDGSGTLLAGLAFRAGTPWRPSDVGTRGQRSNRPSTTLALGLASQGLWALPRAFAGRSVDPVAGSRHR